MEYGKRHREEKRKLVDRVDSTCQISGQKRTGTGELHAHHTHPRTLDFMDEGDMQANYMLILEDYHKKLHEVCDTEHKDLMQQRRQYAKELWNDPNNSDTHQKLRSADNTLIPEYISKLTHKLPYDMRDKVVEVTLNNAFKTNRDLKIQNRSLQLENEELKKEIDMLRRMTKKNIIEIVNYIDKEAL